MKKIAFISSGYLPLPSVRGGAVETLIDNIIESPLVKFDYEIDVYSIYDEIAKKKSTNNENVNYYYIKSKNKIIKTARWFINKFGQAYIGNEFISLLVKEHKDKLSEYDYVIVQNKPEYGLYLKKYVTGKLVFHSHNDFLNKNTKNAKKIFDSYDQIFCLSKYICERVNDINPKSKKVKLLYNGVDNDKFVGIINILNERKKYGLNIDDVVFLYTGRLVKEKGIEELIRAFNKINNKKFKLLVTGSIGYGKTTKNKFTKKLQQLSENNKNIIYTGYIDYSDIHKLYMISDCGIVPSIWEEPFALTVIEHLSSGHPVIITESGAMPELITNQCSIIVKKDEDKIVEELINAIYNIEKMIKEKDISDICIKQAQQFSKDKYINKFKQLIEEME